MGIRSSDRERKGEEPPSSLVVNTEGPAGAVLAVGLTIGQDLASRSHGQLESVLGSSKPDPMLIWLDAMSIPDAEVEGRHGEGLRSKVPPPKHQHDERRHTGRDRDGLAVAEMG